MESPPFELLEPANVIIAGAPSTDMIIRAATGRTLGRLRGFVVESAHQQIRYLIVKASGLFGKTTLIPFSAPRIDLEERAIEVEVDDRDLWILRNLTPDQLLSRVIAQDQNRAPNRRDAPDIERDTRPRGPRSYQNHPCAARLLDFALCSQSGLYRHHERRFGSAPRSIQPRAFRPCQHGGASSRLSEVAIGRHSTGCSRATVPLCGAGPEAGCRA